MKKAFLLILVVSISISCFAFDLKINNNLALKVNPEFDFRFIITGKADDSSATLPAGKTRYGGNGSKRNTNFDISSFIINLDLESNKKFLWHTTLGYNAEMNNDSVVYDNFGIVETYLYLKDFYTNANLKVGAFSLNFSKEHKQGPGLSKHTITPSAANTFLKNGIRVWGLEYQYNWINQLDFSVGLVSGIDRLGQTIISNGWNLNDRYNFIINKGTVLNSGENDGDFGYYTSIEYRLPSEYIVFNMDYLDNGADKKDGNLETSFMNIGLEINPFSPLQLTGQVLTGKSQDTTAKYNFRTWFTSLLYDFGITKASIRYEEFQANLKNNNGKESGYAITGGLILPYNENFETRIEYISVNSKIKTSTQTADPKDNLFQVSTRFSF